jgi:hypothetical protein
MQDLHEIEAIKRLKYKYMRCLDLKRWDEMEECFTEDARSAYSSGKYSFQGRDRILEFFRTAMGPEMITTHHVHHPEVELTSESTATGRWALEDTVIHLTHDITLRGAAFYEDEYVKEDGQWRIASTGYERIYEEVQSRKDVRGLELTQNMWAEQ